MTKKTTADITPEQLAHIDDACKKWLGIGLSVARCDREKAEAVISKLVLRLRPDVPPIHWADSPMAGIELGAKLTGMERNKVWDTRWSSLWGGFLAHCHELEACKIITLPPETRALLDDWIAACETIHIALILDTAIILVERPTSIWRDAQNRLHSPGSAALEYADGWGLYVYHGTRVPKKAVLAPDTYTQAELQAERNSEVHRVIAEQVGAAKYLEMLGGHVVDTWRDETTALTYELVESGANVGDVQPKWLRMQSPPLHDGTQPTFVEPVHPELRTAQAARKWQIQLSTDKNARYYRHGDVVVTYADPSTLYWPTPEEVNENPHLKFESEA